MDWQTVQLAQKDFGASGAYSFTTVQPLTSQFTDLGAQIYQLLASGKDPGYRQAESYYNAFVYANDRQLPAALESLFKQELGEAGDRNQGHAGLLYSHYQDPSLSGKAYGRHTAVLQILTAKVVILSVNFWKIRRLVIVYILQQQLP